MVISTWLENIPRLPPLNKIDSSKQTVFHEPCFRGIVPVSECTVLVDRSFPHQIDAVDFQDGVVYFKANGCGWMEKTPNPKRR